LFGATLGLSALAHREIERDPRTIRLTFLNVQGLVTAGTTRCSVDIACCIIRLPPEYEFKMDLDSME